MLPRLVRKTILALAMGLFVYLVAAGWGKLAAGLAAAGCLAAVGALTVWLPRAAHRAFERGDFDRAALLYAALRHGLLDGGARGAAEVSLAACDLARGRYPAARRRLDRVELGALSEAVRSAWHNNCAYALVRAGGDADAALEHVGRALALRPEVVGFRHTRGVVLLALGRVDEAIGELDAVWEALEGADPPPLLEAERCFDLGSAWQSKGEPEYACDYFERAQRAAPASIWAERAAARAEPRRRRPGSAALP